MDFPIGFKVTEDMLERGIAIYPGGKGTADGVNGDHILIAPPYTITEEELDTIASELRKSIDSVVDTYKRGGHVNAKTMTV
jgi:adenosylmethionine-8-amino-7-oxononanoate aminotransferase